MTLVCKVGAERARSSETFVEGGAITPGLNNGAARVPFDGTFGAGAMMVGSSAGINSVCSERTVGAGGTTAAFKVGAVRIASGETSGAGGITVLIAMDLRDWSREMSAGAGAITLPARLLARNDDCSPSDEGGARFAFAGALLRASKFATASLEAGIFRSGASTILGESAPPRAT